MNKAPSTPTSSQDGTSIDAPPDRENEASVVSSIAEYVCTKAIAVEKTLKEGDLSGFYSELLRLEVKKPPSYVVLDILVPERTADSGPSAQTAQLLQLNPAYDLIPPADMQSSTVFKELNLDVGRSTTTNAQSHTVRVEPTGPVGEETRSIKLKEIFRSEVTFYQKLRALQEIYRVRLSEKWTELQFNSITEAQKLAPDVKGLIELSTGFLAAMGGTSQERVMDESPDWTPSQCNVTPGEMAVAFMKMVDDTEGIGRDGSGNEANGRFVKSFESFFGKREVALRLLRHRKQGKDQSLHELLEICNDEAEQKFGFRTTLDNILVEPVQRVARYPMVLRELLEKTPKEHPERMHIERAWQVAVRAAEAINETEREMSMKTFMQNFSRALGPGNTLASATTTFVREFEIGMVTEVDANGQKLLAGLDGKPVYLMVFSTRILLLRSNTKKGKPVDPSKSAYDLLHDIPLHNMSAFDSADADFKIVLETHPGKDHTMPPPPNPLQIFVLRARKASEKEEILRVLRHTLVQHAFQPPEKKVAGRATQLFAERVGEVDVYYNLRVVTEKEMKEAVTKPKVLRRSVLHAERPVLILCDDAEFVPFIGVLQSAEQQFRFTFRHRQNGSTSDQSAPAILELPEWSDSQVFKEKLSSSLKRISSIVAANAEDGSSLLSLDYEAELLLLSRKFPLAPALGRKPSMSIFGGRPADHATGIDINDSDKWSIGSGRSGRGWGVGRTPSMMSSKSSSRADVDPAQDFGGTKPGVLHRPAVDLGSPGWVGERKVQRTPSIRSNFSFRAPSIRLLGRGRPGKEEEGIEAAPQARAPEPLQRMHALRPPRKVSRAESTLQKMRRGVMRKFKKDERVRDDGLSAPTDTLGVQRGDILLMLTTAIENRDSPKSLMKKVEKASIEDLTRTVKHFIVAPRGCRLMPVDVQEEILKIVRLHSKVDERPSDADLVPDFRNYITRNMNEEGIKTLGAFLEHLRKVSLASCEDGTVDDELCHVMAPILFDVHPSDSKNMAHALIATECLLWLGCEIAHTSDEAENDSIYSETESTQSYAVSSDVTDASHEFRQIPFMGDAGDGGVRANTQQAAQTSEKVSVKAAEQVVEQDTTQVGVDSASSPSPRCPPRSDSMLVTESGSRIELEDDVEMWQGAMDRLQFVNVQLRSRVSGKQAVVDGLGRVVEGLERKVDSMSRGEGVIDRTLSEVTVEGTGEESEVDYMDSTVEQLTDVGQGGVGEAGLEGQESTMGYEKDEKLAYELLISTSKENVTLREVVNAVKVWKENGDKKYLELAAANAENNELFARLDRLDEELRSLVEKRDDFKSTLADLHVQSTFKTPEPSTLAPAADVPSKSNENNKSRPWNEIDFDFDKGPQLDLKVGFAWGGEGQELVKGSQETIAGSEGV
ncbi:Rho guanine nucleotide exchange factor 3 [Rhizophlyctis rosea]|nr:Rho guanine nucleotide exchange factor 3 [Rhizophlyctis rosea]